MFGLINLVIHYIKHVLPDPVLPIMAIYIFYIFINLPFLFLSKKMKHH